MAQLQLDKLKFDHIGLVVKDIDKAVDFYGKAFGLKFDEIAQHQLPPDVITRGKPTPYTMRVTFAPMGPFRLEMVQILEGESLHTEFLKKKGEGVHHLAYEVADLDKEVANAQSQGLEMICYLKMFDIMAFAYFDNLKTNGVLIELVQENVREKLMAKLAGK
ncbi:MAG: VOC family protein [Dehalococcoidia bacterium]|nr:VOC family protein [Dehalococcoidia bacterium]